MDRDLKIASIVGIPLIVAAVALAVLVVRKGGFHPSPPITMEGAVLKQNSDARKQIPLAGVSVTASDGETTVETESAPSGFFTVTLGGRALKRGPVTLSFTSPGYEPLELTTKMPEGQLYIARLRSLTAEPVLPAKAIEIKNVRVSFSSKDQSTVSIGSLTKEFSAPNTGNVPCRGRKPCSPDGRWKATETVLPLDADRGNQFRNVRISCMAGPCAFTSIGSVALAPPPQKLKVSVLNWSDTTSFLVEADVTRTMVSDRVRQSYPFIIGQTMSFALPAGAMGLTIEADLDDQHIVFPLGPELLLSWATCTIEASQDGSQIGRCQAKPGYRFQQTS